MCKRYRSAGIKNMTTSQNLFMCLLKIQISGHTYTPLVLLLWRTLTNIDPPRCSQQTILHVSVAGSIISSPLNKSLSEEWDPGNSPQSEFTPESCDGGLDCLKNQRFVYPLTLRKTGYCILSRLLKVVASRLCYIRTCFLHGQM